ncbi:MAG: GNAT family N-acetyltransferase [Alphaproteobacteria bacterium]
MDEVVIRSAGRKDAAAVAAIYRPIVTGTVISFELKPPTAEEMAQRMERAGDSHAWLVADVGGAIAGCAYGKPHRPRAAYQHAVETSAYIHGDFRGRGIAGRLYEQLFRDLAGKGYFHAFAGITLPNDASVALHKSVGFTSIDCFPRVGYKLGAWHDVSWWYAEIRNGEPG